MNLEEDENELAAFERLVQGLSSIEPSAALKSRLMEAVKEQLDSPLLPLRPRANFLSFVAVMAATLLICASLSMIAASTTSLHTPAKTSSPMTPENVAIIEQLSPDLTRDDAMRLSLLLQGSDHLSSLPLIDAPISSAQQTLTADDLQRISQ